ncbi:MAG: nicotinate (nicotinamide) nucleotide adenylyltransferase [Limnohabitans sp.]
MSGPRRIGVFGGAFDPPHLAHVALLCAAIDQLALDEVRVLPTGQAWHKARALTTAAHRLAMARLAFAGLPQVQVDEPEIRRPGPSYTIDTLQELVAECPGAQFFLLIGEDQRRALASWHRIGEIGQLAIICAAARPADVAPWNAVQAPAQAPESLLAGILPLQMPLMPVSATDIRQRLSHQQPVSGLVPAAVERYIHEHHLYGPEPRKPLR